MLQSSSGSDLQRHSFQIQILDSSSVGEARRLATRITDSLGFDDTQTARASIVINELGNNLVRYARNGRLLLTTTGSAPDGLDIVSIDEGPGLKINDVMQDGYSTGDTPGTGMGAVQRQSDQFDIYSQPEKGTVILSRILRKPESRRQYDTAAIALPLRGENVSGDNWAFAEDDDRLEIITVDGLGHGERANQAALEATEVFQNTHDESIERQIQMIHGRLKSTRGAAVFRLNVGPTTLQFSGIGNVRALWQGHLKTKVLLSQNGTAGIQIRTPRTLSETWDQSGYIILHTDGVLNRFNLLEYPGLLNRHPALIAAILIRDFCRGTDDATVFVARKVV